LRCLGGGGHSLRRRSLYTGVRSGE
jgi:hypothetical protein